MRRQTLHLSILMSVFDAGYPGGIFDPLGYSKGNMEVCSQSSARYRPFTRNLPQIFMLRFLNSAVH